MEAAAQLADQLFEEYLRLQEEIASGRRPKAVTVLVSICCHRPCYVDRATGWDLCSACHKRTTYVELTATVLRGSAYNAWKKIHLKERKQRRVNPQERWTSGLIDRRSKVRRLFETKPRSMKWDAWVETLRCWAYMMLSTYGSHEAVAREFGLAPGEVRYRIERAREIVAKRYAKWC